MVQALVQQQTPPRRGLVSLQSLRQQQQQQGLQELVLRSCHVWTVQCGQCW